MRKLEGEERLGLEYWLRWQVLVCAIITMIPAFMSVNFLKSRSEKGILTDDRRVLWIPGWKRMNPIWLLVFRGSAFVSMACLLYQMVAIMGLFAFYFYTQWTFALVMIYFGIATIVSARGCFGMYNATTATTSTFAGVKNNGKAADEVKNRGEEAEKDNNSKKLQDTDNTTTSSSSHNLKPRTQPLECLMVIIYQTSAGAAVLTDLVFWCWCLLVPTLAGKEFEITPLTAATHSVNALFLILDSAFNRIPFGWPGFPYFTILTALYGTFQWFLHAIGFTTWPYPFLDLARPWAPFWYLSMALVHFPCYGLYVTLINAKNYTFSNFFPRAYIKQKGT